MIPVVFRGRSSWPPELPPIASLRPPAADLAEAIERTLQRGEYPSAATIVITKNRRRMISVRIREQRFELALCWRLLNIPDVVVNATTHYLEWGSFPIELRDAIADLEPLSGALTTIPSGDARGVHVDLDKTLDELGVLVPEFADQTGQISIGWSRGQRRDRASRRSIRLGSANPTRRSIRIHPTLDRPDVPEYVLQMVVFHELCHHLAPPLSRSVARERAERCRIHHPQFREIESRFPRLDEAKRWVRRHFNRLSRF